MYRILHLSDLHLNVHGLHLENPLNLARKTQVNVLDRLRTICKSLQPKLIVVTGDLTEFGDAKSFTLARKRLKEIKDASRADRVLCIPGNHDLYGARLLTFILKLWSDPMTNYRSMIKNCYGKLAPDDPVTIKTVWGRIAIFLFNSNYKWSRDRGRISDDQLSALSRYAADRSRDEVRIALIHHHPQSAPSENLGFQQRKILMLDGARFVANLKDAGFHIVMHGHQHVPFYSASWIETEPGSGTISLLHVLAGGTALVQGGQPRSFNVLDILSPFEADYWRYDFDEKVHRKFIENKTERRSLKLFDSSIRLDSLNESAAPRPDPPENPRDIAATNLRRVVRVGVDCEHKYDLIEYEARVDDNHHYHGTQRRQGRVMADKSDGWLYVLVGEPGVALDKLDLEATDNNSRNDLKYKAVVDEPRRKVIRVLASVALKKDERFDVTLKFCWPTALHDPNDYDGFNLLYFTHQIAKIRYEVEVRWTPCCLKLWSCGARIETVGVHWKKNHPKYSFEMENTDKPLLHAPYIIQIGEQPL